MLKPTCKSSMKHLLPTGAIVCSLVLLLSGCATMDELTGKDLLNQKVDKLKAENEELKEKVSTLAKSLQVERARGSGIKMVLFGGDIIYEIQPASYTMLRAGIRLRAVRDPEFGENFERYEHGNGGDSQVLGLLREIDLNRDRIIDETEGIEFRGKEEVIFQKPDRRAAEKSARK